MKRQLLLNIHRWLGLGATFFLIILSVTGLLLNHTSTLKLDEIKVRNSFILGLYGLESADSALVYQGTDSANIAYIKDNLFFNENFISKSTPPIACLELKDFNAILTQESIYLISEEGHLIERIKPETLPYERLKGIGEATNPNAPDTSSAAYILNTVQGNFTVDSYWMTFKPFNGDFVSIPNLEPSLGNEPYIERLLKNFQGDGVPLYRVLLDLHSGKLFSIPGQTAMDLTAIAILILIVSGLLSWNKKRRIKLPKHFHNE